MTPVVDVEWIAYTNPHEQPPGRHRPVGWVWDELMTHATDVAVIAAQVLPGWHGPLPADLHAQHVAREQQQAQERHDREQARQALQARRDAEPVWTRVRNAIDMHGGYESDPESAADAVMDLIYGEGQW